MMEKEELRYEDAGEAEYKLLNEVRTSHFPDLVDANIKVIFDLRKKMSGGKIILGRIYKANELIKHITLDENLVKGVDFIIFLDRICWDNIPEVDKVRIIRHELRHTIVFPEKKFPFNLMSHDIEDFVSEVQLNQDDVGWRQRVATLTSTIYQQREEEEKEAKKLAKGPRKRRGAAVAKLL